MSIAIIPPTGQDDLEQRRRDAEALADAEHFQDMEREFLSGMHEQRRGRIGDAEGPIPPSLGRGKVVFKRCDGCGKVKPRSALNTLVSTRSRGGGYAGESHKQTRKLCSECIVSKL